MPPSRFPMHRFDLIERELTKAMSEYPDESALDRMKFVRALVGVLKHQIEVDDEATIPVLDEEIEPREEYRRG